MAGLLTNIGSLLAEFGLNQFGGKLARGREEEERIRQAQAVNDFITAREAQGVGLLQGVPASSAQFTPELINLPEGFQRHLFSGETDLATAQSGAAFNQQQAQQKSDMATRNELIINEAQRQGLTEDIQQYKNIKLNQSNESRLGQTASSSEAGAAGNILNTVKTGENQTRNIAQRARLAEIAAGKAHARGPLGGGKNKKVTGRTQAQLQDAFEQEFFVSDINNIGVKIFDEDARDLVLFLARYGQQLHAEDPTLTEGEVIAKTRKDNKSAIDLFKRNQKRGDKPKALTNEEILAGQNAKIEAEGGPGFFSGAKAILGFPQDKAPTPPRDPQLPIKKVPAGNPQLRSGKFGKASMKGKFAMIRAMEVKGFSPQKIEEEVLARLGVGDLPPELFKRIYGE